MPRQNNTFTHFGSAATLSCRKCTGKFLTRVCQKPQVCQKAYDVQKVVSINILTTLEKLKLLNYLVNSSQIC